MVEADPQVVGTAPLVPESDGFRPAARAEIQPRPGPGEFERSTLEALNVYDPLESVNRRIYHFTPPRPVLLPLVNGYQYITPSFVRTGVSNFFNNLGDVPNLFNSVLQLGQTLGRDHRAADVQHHHWRGRAVGPGDQHGSATAERRLWPDAGLLRGTRRSHLMLPLLGPSNLRDTTGLAVDYAGEQSINYLNVADASKDHPEIFALRVVDKRYNTKFRYGQLNSPFEYEKVRYVYTQSRKLQIAE